MNLKSRKMWRCAIYTRVSTDDQTKGTFTSTQAQEQQAKQFIQSKSADGWVYSQTFEDGGYSGKRLNRPSLQELITEIRAGRIDAVIVYRRDRLSREPKHIDMLEALFERYGVRLISCTEPDLGKSAASKLKKGIMDLLSGYEVDLTTERIQDNLRQRAEKGIWKSGNPSYGYTYSIQDKMLYPVETEAIVVRRIFDEACHGKSLAEIAQILKDLGYQIRPYNPKTTHSVVLDDKKTHQRHFTPARIKAVIQNSIYCGKLRARNPELRESDSTEGMEEFKLYPGNHTPLVSHDTWMRANELLKTTKVLMPRLSERDKLGYILKSLLVCKDCDYLMTTTYSGKRRPDGQPYRFYRCIRAAKEGAKCGCPNRAVPADGIEAAVLAYLTRVVTQPGLIDKTTSMFSTTRSEDLTAAEKQLTLTKAEYTDVCYQLERCVEQVTKNSPEFGEVLKEKASELARKRHELDMALTRLSTQVGTLKTAQPDARQIKDALTNFSALVKVQPIPEQKNLLKAICERIEISRPTSAAYLHAVKSGAKPRMFRVQLLLCMTNMQMLNATNDEISSHVRPKSNFELSFTVHFPPTRKSQDFEFYEGEEVVKVENEMNADKAMDDSLNVIKKAREWRERREKASTKSDKEFAAELAVSPSTLSFYLKVLRKLNPRIQTWLGHCQDPETLRRYSLRRLLKYTEMTESAQMDEFRQELEANSANSAN